MSPKKARNDCERLAEQITKAMIGEAWHGPSWRDNVEGVTREDALRRPIAGGHTIAEIVLHMTTWNHVVRRRMEGETPNVTGALDWPKGALKDDAAWEAVVAKLFESGDALAATVAAFPEGKLHKKRPSVDGTWFDLVLGQLQHILYHAGQAGLLRKAVTKR
ncbi:MAG TPA: DinB family protein [Candidatus Eisenbacteria bacterium]|nr:DinB family protein [Candidatus Eisenbacteria bacterium]